MDERMNVTYGIGSGRDLLLDIYAPDAANNQRTAVLLFHGGGWRRGDRTMMTSHAKLLRTAGFTAMPAQYRLLDEAPWPSAVHDVKAAIRWARANAGELAVEPDKIVLAGFSAGAHLSLVAAGTPGVPEFEGDGGNSGVDTSVAAITAFYPPTVFHTGDARQRGSVPAEALLDDAPDPEAARLASPLAHVSAAFPPTFFLHGGADSRVPASASVVMYEALRAAGVETDLHVFAGQDHAFDHVDAFRRVASQEMVLFFRRMASEKDLIAQQVLEQNSFAARTREAALAGGTR